MTINVTEVTSRKCREQFVSRGLIIIRTKSNAWLSSITALNFTFYLNYENNKEHSVYECRNYGVNFLPTNHIEQLRVTESRRHKKTLRTDNLLNKIILS